MDDSQIPLFPPEPPHPPDVPGPAWTPPSGRSRRWLIALLALLGVSLIAFGVTTFWLSRLATPLAIAEADTQATSLVRAHFAALERGDFRAAYDQFSARYRDQIPFAIFREIMATHWSLLQGQVTVIPQSATPARVVLGVDFSNPAGATINAEFTLVRTAGRWWIDNVRWGRERLQHLIRS